VVHADNVTEKLHARKNQRYVCRAWLMSRGSSIGRGEVTQGKPGVTSMPCAVENPTWLTYTSCGNIAFYLKTDKDL